MGFRFRRSIRILPGVRVNLSRSGISTSIGGRGAHVNFGKIGTRTAVELRGTGISYAATRPLDDSATHQAYGDGAGVAQPEAVLYGPPGARSVTGGRVLLYVRMFVLAVALLGIMASLVLR